MMKQFTTVFRNSWVQLAMIMVIYLALSLPTVGRQGISWDEQNDLGVARSYLAPDGWLVGSAIDPSQTRLPMFVVALVFNLLGLSDLITARVVSCLVGAITLLGVFVYCKRSLDERRGLLAVGLLATSPFYLSFTRVAFTETDIYLACVLIWLLVAVSSFQEQPVVGKAAVVGVVLGLALSAKFTMLAVFPAVWYAVVHARGKSTGYDSQIQGNILSFWINWMLASILLGLGFIFISSPGTYTGQTRLFHYSLVLLAWMLPLGWSVWMRHQTAARGSMAVFITLLAVFTFLIIPPEHLTNPEILGSLEWRLRFEMPHPLSFAIEAGALHILAIFFKSSPIIGIGLLLSLTSVTLQLRGGKLLIPLLMTWLYFVGLLSLPLAQTFYTIPLLPMLAIFTANQFLWLWERWRKLAWALVALAMLSLGADLVLCYPDYNLNGYQWLGSRVIAGRSSLGYRSIVQTPSDGVQQAFEWLNQHAGKGDRILAFLLPWHIVQATAPSPAYRIKNGFQMSLDSMPEFVVVHINAQVRQSWWTDASQGEVFNPPYDKDWLEMHYSKVFSVPRRFGIEMASVWQKKP